MNHPDLLCLGAAHWDILGTSAQPIAAGGDVPGHIIRHPGGVALNIARALVAHGQAVGLVAPLGQDEDGAALRRAIARAGIATEFLHLSATLPTGRYMAIEAEGALIAAVADTAALEAAGAELVAQVARLVAEGFTGQIVADSGILPDDLRVLAETCGGQLALVAASPAKAPRLKGCVGHGARVYLNRGEAEALLAQPLPTAHAAALALCAAGFSRAIVTDGPRPVCDADAQATLSADPPEVTPNRATGAGDVFLAAHITAERAGLARAEALDIALAASAAHITHA